MTSTFRYYNACRCAMRFLSLANDQGMQAFLQMVHQARCAFQQHRFLRNFHVSRGQGTLNHSQIHHNYKHHSHKYVHSKAAAVQTKTLIVLVVHCAQSPCLGYYTQADAHYLSEILVFWVHLHSSKSLVSLIIKMQSAPL